MLGVVSISFLPSALDAWSGWFLAVLTVLLVYQQRRLYRFRQEAARREELFRIVAENAADMIALVDVKGRRIYNSPAYQKVLGYTPQELAKTSAFEQIHQEDRMRVLEAAREARRTGLGKKLEYRIRHKDGSWLVFESTASAIKNQYGEVVKLVIVNRDVTDRKRSEKLLEHSSLHDVLTGLPNRRLFLDRLQCACARARRNPEFQYAVLVVDVDNFNGFNESMGQAAGDRMILEVGRRLNHCLGPDDTVARPQDPLPLSDPLLSRLGGDEFTLLLEEIRDPSDAVRVARRIQGALSLPWPAEGREVLASVSIGIALSTSVRERGEDLLQDADTAMRRAKAMGGSRCEVFDEAMHARAMTRLQLEGELKAALDQHQYQLYYQPIVQLDTRRVVGFEGLLRWPHPKKGMIAADSFIAVAEDVGVVVSTGKWAIHEACRQLEMWQYLYPFLNQAGLTFNLSAKQLTYPGLVDDIRAALEESRLRHECVQVEIGEAESMTDPKFTCELMNQFRQIGLRISLGNFGSAKTSLAWLSRFPLDEIKIDRSIVAGVLTDRHCNELIALIVSLARTLGVRVVAEGIESTLQLSLLQRLGCDLGQGYLFSHPLPSTALESWLQSGLKANAASR